MSVIGPCVIVHFLVHQICNISCSGFNFVKIVEENKKCILGIRVWIFWKSFQIMKNAFAYGNHSQLIFSGLRCPRSWYPRSLGWAKQNSESFESFFNLDGNNKVWLERKYIIVYDKKYNSYKTAKMLKIILLTFQSLLSYSRLVDAVSLGNDIQDCFDDCVDPTPLLAE